MENLKQALSDVPSQPEQMPEPAAAPVPEPVGASEPAKAVYPRTQQEIAKDYWPLLRRVGELSYQRALLDEELRGEPVDGLFMELKALNREASRRSEIDQNLAKEKMSKAEAKRARKMAAAHARAKEQGLSIEEGNKLAQAAADGPDDSTEDISIGVAEAPATAVESEAPPT